MAINKETTRWTPLIVQALREAGFPEKDLAMWTAAGLALMYRESRGNPDAEHSRTKAFGLFQAMPKYHPINRGNPLAQIRLWATSMGRYQRQTDGSIPSGLMVWASGPGALRKFVESGEAAHNKVLPHLRNIQDMTGGAGWRSASSFLTGWTEAGSPTTKTMVGRQRYDLAVANVRTGPALASPWDGRVYWYGKSRRVGSRGPGGVTGLTLARPELTGFLPLAIVAGLLMAFFAFWGGGK